MELSSRGLAGTGFSGSLGSRLTGAGGEEPEEPKEVEESKIWVWWWEPVEGGPRGVATGDPEYVFHRLLLIFASFSSILKAKHCLLFSARKR